REVGEHLAVDVDLGRLQAGHESRVRDVVLAASGVDANDPEPPELALARAPVAVGVPERVHDLLVRLAEVTAARTGVTLRFLEDCAAVLLATDGTLHPCHRTTSPTSAGRSSCRDPSPRPRGRDAACAVWACARASDPGTPCGGGSCRSR